MTLTNLHQIPRHAAERDPEAVAYRFQGAHLTTQHFEEQVARLTFTLQKQGVANGDRVAICLRKSPKSVIAAMAIMAAGGVYVPLDPTAPEARWAHILTQCNIRHLITEHSLTPKLNALTALNTPLEWITGAEGEWKQSTTSWDSVSEAERAKPVTVATDDPAYIMFTSGSTGTPKGIVHTHASGLSYLRAVNALYDVRPADRIALHAGLHFDVSLWPMFGALMAGASCSIVPDVFTRLPAEMVKLIAQDKLTLWYSVPYALMQMLEHGAMERFDLSSLRWIVYAGEPFQPAPMRQMMQRLPGTRFSNNYGPAEVNAVTYMHVSGPDDIPDTGVPIGRTFAHTRAFVIDADDQPVSPGTEGELVLHTKAMMQAYWNDPHRSQSSLWEHDGQPFYRSGDIVIEDQDGVFHMLGRKDRQIKVRGARVELDEVELVLNACPGVLESVALPTPDGTAVMAALVFHDSADRDVAKARDHAAAHLPGYSVPQQIIAMDHFPRTGSDKIDRRAIAAQMAGS